jgi:DNA-binding response OmpR family regulator
MIRNPPRGGFLLACIRSARQRSVLHVSSNLAPDMSAQILCVDDDARDLELHGELLRGAGFKVFDAPDTRAAMEFFMHEPVDLVLLDFALVGTDGGILAFEMRRRKPAIKIAFLCGEPNAPMPRHIVDAVISKNSEPGEIIDAVRQLLASSPSKVA